MMRLQLRALTKTFPGQDGAAVRGISTSVTQGNMLVLLGPSGCGKSTSLRMVAGLIDPDEGEILMDGKTIARAGWSVPPERRNIGMVFQNYAVWPHKTVFENVAYGLQLRRLKREDIRRRVEQALQRVHLAALAERYPGQLSGGQQQRVALARAIVVDPAVLLLDEPLSNLDAALREQMRVELKTLQRDLGLTSIYVTHDQAEAMMLADHLVVMRDGLIEQQGSAEEIYKQPRSAFLAEFLGSTNLLRGQLIRIEGTEAQVEVPTLGRFVATLCDGLRGAVAVGDTVGVSIRPMGVAILEAARDESVNCFAGQITGRVFLGDLTEYTVKTNSNSWRIQRDSSWPLPVGMAVWLAIPAAKAVIVTNT